MNAVSLSGLSAIAIGAVLGAWLRFALSLWLNPKHTWLPWGTFAANAVGALLIGLALAHLNVRSDISPLWRLFFVTGFLGALTTFSTFSAEVTQLLMAGDVVRGLLLAALHLLCSLILTVLGFKLYTAFN